jgi:hypothetical protein
MTGRAQPDEGPGRSLRHYESVVDQQIRQAEERGDFADLPGLGKPLKGLDRSDDDLWWVKDYLMREELPTEALLPTPLLLRRERERLPELVRELPSEQAVRDLVAAFNKRVMAELRAPAGPWRPVGPANTEALVAEWRTAHQPTPAPPTADTAGDSHATATAGDSHAAATAGPTATVTAGDRHAGDDGAVDGAAPWWRRWRRKAS